MFTIYAAMVNADLTEGRGPMVPVGHFTHSIDASNLLKHYTGVQGTDAGKEVRQIVVYDSADEHPKLKELADVRKRALDKLTPGERKALGY